MKTVILVVGVALVVGAAAAAGGYLYGQNAGKAQAQAEFEAFLAERLSQSAGTAQPGAVTGQGFGGGQGLDRQGAGAGVTGSVESVDGQTLTVKGSDGASVKVLVTENTTISKTTKVEAAELAAGEQVTIMGQRDTEGNLVARMIQVGQGGFGVFGGAAPGGGFPQGGRTAP